MLHIGIWGFWFISTLSVYTPYTCCQGIVA
jgi:hypothetical protein